MQSQKTNRKIMNTAPVQERSNISPTNPVMGLNAHDTKDYLTREEFMDKLAHQLGSLYGLNDIREAQ